MELLPCRTCGQPIDPTGGPCPHCGSTRSLLPPKQPGYEWKSAWLWMGFPVVHIAFGCDAKGRPLTARGVVAIGQRAIGGVSVGILAGGFFSFGMVSIGVFSVGVVSLGGLIAVGLNAFAPVAIGVVAVGYKVGGAAVFGWKTLFSAGH